MKAVITLDEGEIIKACLEYLKKQGWKTSGGLIQIKRGYSDDCEMTSTPDKATFVVGVDFEK